MEFIERLKLELEDLQEFLRGLPLNIPVGRVGDFGCEWGYTTLSLMLALNAAECVGIDTFSGRDTSLTLGQAQQKLDDVKAKILAMPEASQDDDLVRELQNLVRNGRFPVLKQDDIVQSNNLPQNLDFAFCKLVLRNIHEGSYGNSIKREQGIDLAVKNIATSTKHGGLVCFIEKNVAGGVDIVPFLEAHLTFLRICHIRRGDILTNGRAGLSTINYTVYTYKKS